MKNIANILICTFVLGSTLTFAGQSEDKATATPVNALPASAPALESPAPQKDKLAADTKYSAEQKASLVELKLKSAK
ncbi:hypothetical protein DSL64_20775 [Dyadobacter luteus]|jgi:hypothetical protein|uniref:Uncharacterized protein n=1 Tax=Dyadobacter luteus TaxID=2259619 RepID=A0A3D8Y6N0_9BACT|nr:hypothetical protein [Dyadobacter luteus]REA58522.1 hypothetical protein DSL64_20775 [Dyadobacter luteus]